MSSAFAALTESDDGDFAATLLELCPGDAPVLASAAEATLRESSSAVAGADAALLIAAGAAANPRRLLSWSPLRLGCAFAMAAGAACIGTAAFGLTQSKPLTRVLFDPPRGTLCR